MSYLLFHDQVQIVLTTKECIVLLYWLAVIRIINFYLLMLAIVVDKVTVVFTTIVAWSIENNALAIHDFAKLRDSEKVLPFFFCWK